MDTKTGAIRSELEAKQQFSNAIPDRLGHLALLKDYLVASHQIIDVRSGTIVHEFPSLRITHAAFSYDSKLLAIIVRGQPAPKVGKLIIHDIETGKTRTTEVHHDLTRVEFSPDGKYVSLCEGHGYTASLWQVEPLREVHRFPPQGNSFCTAASFSPDQRSILICCVGRNPVLYDLDRKTMIRTFSRLPRTTASVRWSHDGHWVAVYSGGSSVHIYAADTGEMHLQRVFHDSTWVGGVHAPIGFTPDDRFLMTYEAPGVVRYMPIDPLEFTRSLKVRPISAEDMQRFHIGTPEEWATRREEDLEAIGTTRALSKRALLALDHDRLDEAFGWVRRARKLRKRAAPRVLHFVRACVLSRRADRSPESAVQDRRDAIDELKAIKGKFDFGWLESRHLNGLRAEPGFRELMVTSTSELRKRK